MKLFLNSSSNTNFSVLKRRLLINSSSFKSFNSLNKLNFTFLNTNNPSKSIKSIKSTKNLEYNIIKLSNKAFFKSILKPKTKSSSKREIEEENEIIKHLELSVEKFKKYKFHLEKNSNNSNIKIEKEEEDILKNILNDLKLLNSNTSNLKLNLPDEKELLSKSKISQEIAIFLDSLFSILMGFNLQKEEKQLYYFQLITHSLISNYLLNKLKSNEIKKFYIEKTIFLYQKTQKINSTILNNQVILCVSLKLHTLVHYFHSQNINVNFLNQFIHIWRINFTMINSFASRLTNTEFISLVDSLLLFQQQLIKRGDGRVSNEKEEKDSSKEFYSKLTPIILEIKRIFELVSLEVERRLKKEDSIQFIRDFFTVLVISKNKESFDGKKKIGDEADFTILLSNLKNKNEIIKEIFLLYDNFKLRIGKMKKTRPWRLK